MKDEERKSSVLSGEPCPAEFIPFPKPLEQKLIRIKDDPCDSEVLSNLLSIGFIINTISACHRSYTDSYCYVLLEKF
jgi:hypothetical protein